MLPVVLVALAACEPVPPTDMSDVAFPPGFTLDTSREVRFELAASPAEGARLAVRLPDGRPLYDGSAALVGRHPLRLRVPATVTSLRVDLDGLASAVPIHDGVATFGSRP